MIRLRRTSDLPEYRTVLDSDGEVSIGAHARRVRRRRIFTALCGFVLLGGAVWLYVALRPTAGLSANSYPTKLLCTVCGHAEQVVMSVRQPLPMACPRCGKRSWKLLWKCRDCGVEFQPAAGQATFECPACHSLSVGSPVAPTTQPHQQP